MKIQPKNIVITVCVIVITPFVWTLLFSNNGMSTITVKFQCLLSVGDFSVVYYLAYGVSCD